MKPLSTLRISLAYLLLGSTFFYASIAQADISVGLGGETLLVFKSEVDLSKTAKERSDDFYDRLRNTINNPLFKASDIQVKPLGNYGVKIVANGNLIVPIGAREAQAHGSTTKALAETWAAHLRKVLPQLRSRPDLFQKNHSYFQKANIIGTSSR